MKQVIVVNRSLALPEGKLAVQVAHAAFGSFLAATAESQSVWLEVGMPKGANIPIIAFAIIR